MIVQEKNGNLIRTFSDSGYKIIQVETEFEYSEAIDVYPCPYTYLESQNPIDVTEEEATAEDYQQALERLGVEVE